MRVPRVLPTVLDQHSGVAMMALLASEEAAGEFVYVRTSILRWFDTLGKVCHAYVDAPMRAGLTRVGYATEAHEACEVAF